MTAVRGMGMLSTHGLRGAAGSSRRRWVGPTRACGLCVSSGSSVLLAEIQTLEWAL